MPLVRIIMAIIIVSVPVEVAQSIIKTLFVDKTIVAVLVPVAMAGASWAAFWAYVHFIEKRKFTEMAPTGAIKELSSGMLIGMFMFTAMIMIYLLIGVYQITGFNGWSSMIIPLAVAIRSGFYEEILFRGILFKITEDSLGSWLALAISAIVFGLIHLLSPDFTVMGAIAIIIEAGILLAAAYMLTRRLWLAIGIHAAVNFAAAGIYGMGNPFLIKGLLQARLVNPSWMSSEVFSLAVSVTEVLIFLTVGLVFIAIAVRQHHIIKPFWRQRN